MLRKLIARTAVATAFLAASLSVGQGCSNTASDSSFSTESESCKLAAVDDHGYCRAPNGQFSASSCCAANEACASAAIDAGGICRAANGQFAPTACCADVCADAALDAGGYCRNTVNGQFANAACCADSCVGDVAQQSPACGAQIGAVEGFIDEIYIGEMDPFVVGDVCVFYVKDYETDAITGVIEDFCEEALFLSDVDAAGWSVLFEKDGLEEVTAEENEVLQDYRSAVKYYRYWGEVVIPENSF